MAAMLQSTNAVDRHDGDTANTFLATMQAAAALRKTSSAQKYLQSQRDQSLKISNSSTNLISQQVSSTALGGRTPQPVHPSRPLVHFAKQASSRTPTLVHHKRIGVTLVGDTINKQ